MTEFSTFTRRRADRNETNTKSSENQNSATFPSKIPIKSPARSSRPIGGMAVAYSPIKSSIESTNNNETVTTNINNTSNNDSYSKKLLELKNAMDLLKTPPAAIGVQSQSSHISYTPIKSSTLAANNSTIPFDSAIDPIEISMASSSDTETADNDTSLLDAYREDESSFIKDSRNNNIFSSPHGSTITSSPYISSEELKMRLEATKEAFQRSLEAQKRRLRTSLPYCDIDSSFSTCGGFDSDLSVDSFKETRNQLEKIKKEMAEIIESDFEDVKLQRTSHNQTDLIKRESWNWSSFLFKYFVIFSITTIIFIHLFVNYLPNVQKTIVDFFSSFEKENFLEKVEETLNFLLQD